ncbi:hypothetical protein Cgig2_011629 [Carnegiea gigantea]|uniref:Uncharacterized protein n=1 Tax=Carnegiea gigantea TaxID=171969 RepID=A0A9Q1JLX4_9CARY|nr:hypothetical protein Cgig2_011629 [Carnegiea gigantea]
MPPPIPKKKGRPTKDRRRGWDKGKRRKRSATVRYQNCKKLGNNLASCPLLGKKPEMRKPRPKSKNKTGRLRKQVITSEVGPSTSQGRESTDLGARPSNSQPTTVTTTSTSPRRFTRQLLLQPQKSKAKKQRTGHSLSQPLLTTKDSSPNSTTSSPSHPLSSATAEHITNARHIARYFQSEIESKEEDCPDSGKN